MRPGAVRGVLLGAYIVLWLAADLASTQYAQGTGLSVWDVRAALDVLLFIGFGWRWWPLPVALTALRVLVLPHGLEASPLANIAASIPYELALAGMTYLTTRTLRVQFPLRALRDAGLFMGLLCVAAPLLANAVLLVVLQRFGVPLAFFTELLQGWIADATAICVFVPIGTVLVAWNKELVPDEPARTRRAFDAYAWQVAVVVIVVTLEYAIGTRNGLPLVEFAFLPLAWMSISGGIRGAALAIAACDLTATIVHVAWHVPIASQIEYQGFLIASSLTAVLLGAVSSERSGLLEGLKHAAYHDDATGLPNRRSLYEKLDAARGTALALVFVDLADVRLMNEAIGRAGADVLVTSFGKRLREHASRVYTVARTRYDEFAIARMGTSDPSEAIEFVRTVTSEPFEFGDSQLFVEGTIGAIGTTASGGAFESFRQVDLALRRARENAGRTSVYAPHLDTDDVPLPIVELHRAAEAGELVPFFQPIYRFDPQTGMGRLVGAESLLRWRHRERGLLLPADFIDILERTSLGSRVGWDVMAENLRFAQRWRGRAPGFQVWVNFFGRQLFDPQCIELLQSAFEQTGVAPHAVVVEMTETVIAAYDAQVVTTARALRELGVSIAIDDFGVGGSSLSRLRELPVDLLKVDRSFVVRTDVDERARAVANAVVALASELGVETLAEGVESSGQLQTMLAAGCALAQGYALGHPMPAEAFDAPLTV